MMSKDATLYPRALVFRQQGGMCPRLRLGVEKLHVDEAVALAFDNVRMHLVGGGYIGWP